MVVDILRCATFLTRSVRSYLTYWDMLFVSSVVSDGGRCIYICYLFNVKLQMVVELFRYATCFT